MLSSGMADATGPAWHLTSDTLDMQVDSGQIQRAQAWGDERRAIAVSGLNTITADSLDIQMPKQVMRQVWAYGSSRATSKADSTFVEDDWLSGDSLFALFRQPDSLPPPADSTAAPGRRNWRISASPRTARRARTTTPKTSATRRASAGSTSAATASTSRCATARSAPWTSRGKWTACTSSPCLLALIPPPTPRWDGGTVGLWDGGTGGQWGGTRRSRRSPLLRLRRPSHRPPSHRMHADRGGEAIAHGAEPAGRHPVIGLLELEALHGPHLMLADFGRDVDLATAVSS